MWGTVAPIGWNDRDWETMIVYREYYERGRSVPQNATAVTQASVGESYRRPMLIDPHAYDQTAANERSIAQQYMDVELACEEWPRTNLYGEDALVEMVRKALEDDCLLIMEGCPNAASEFQTWQYKRTRDGLVDPKERYTNTDNHLLDAIRGWVATRPVHTQLIPEIVDAPDLFD
jgi:hypothetical protein